MMKFSVLKKFSLISLLCSKSIVFSGIMGLKPTKDSNDRFYLCFYGKIKAIILELCKISPDTQTPKKVQTILNSILKNPKQNLEIL